MDHFYVVTLFQFQCSGHELENIEARAINEYGAMGIEEFSLSEAQVDEILGERSYSGGDLPIEIIEEVESTVARGPQSFRFFFEDVKSASDFKRDIQSIALCEIQLEECPEEDWNAEWKKHYAPIIVNNKLEIVPSWSKDIESKSEKKIAIYPGMGFGTGSHETTFLCLKLFTEELLSKKIDEVLDFGSGSGILGLAALLFNPEAKVDFYDIDPEANKNCFQNAELNGLVERSFRLLLPEVRDRLIPQYDIVFANILESILIMEKTALIEHVRPGGSLILSGLLRHQVSGIIEAYSRAGVSLQRKEEKGDWAALLFVK
jgi:ribosomal protein L11 methyltransferase